MARDSGGTWSAPNLWPAVDGTVGTAAQVNQLMNDLGGEITDSLSRSGKGGMTAAFKVANGSAGSPSIAFSNDSAVGIYRSASGEASIVAGGAAVAKWTTAGWFASLLQSLTAVTLRLLGRMADGATAVGVVLDTDTTYSNAAAKLVSIRNNTVEKAYIDKAGRYVGIGGSQVVYLAANADNSTSTEANVTGMAFAVEASSVYRFEAYIDSFRAGTGTNFVIDFTGPASPTSFQLTAIYNAAGVATFTSPSGFGTDLTITSGVIADHQVTVLGSLVNGTNAGTVQLRFKSSDNATLCRMLPGSYIRFVRLA